MFLQYRDAKYFSIKVRLDREIFSIAVLQKHVFYVLFCIFEKWYTINSQFRGPEGSDSTLSEQHKCYFALLSLLRTSADPRRRLRSTLIALLSKVQGLIWGCDPSNLQFWALQTPSGPLSGCFTPLR